MKSLYHNQKAFFTEDEEKYRYMYSIPPKE